MAKGGDEGGEGGERLWAELKGRGEAGREWRKMEVAEVLYTRDEHEFSHARFKHDGKIF